jgi:hypothetical protein
MDQEMILTLLVLVFIVYVATSYWFYVEAKMGHREENRFNASPVDVFDELSFIVVGLCWPIIVIMSIVGEFMLKRYTYK